jgi:predicted transcriptional regulator
MQPASAHTPTPSTENLPPKISVAQMLVYELRVRDAMSRPPVTAQPEDSMRTIQDLMKCHRISGVPIKRNGGLLGIVTIEDIIRALDTGHINDPAERWMTREVVSLRDHFSLVRAVAEFDRHGFGRFPVLDGTHVHSEIFLRKARTP